MNFTILFIFGLVGISASFLPPPSEQDRAEPEVWDVLFRMHESTLSHAAPDWRTQLWALYIEVSIWSLILMASSGIYLCLFILTYAVSSVQVAYPSWFSSTPTITEREIVVGPEMASNPRALAKDLMDHHGLRGRLGKIRKTDDGFLPCSFPQPSLSSEAQASTSGSKSTPNA